METYEIVAIVLGAVAALMMLGAVLLIMGHVMPFGLLRRRSSRKRSEGYALDAADFPADSDPLMF